MPGRERLRARAAPSRARRSSARSDRVSDRLPGRRPGTSPATARAGGLPNQAGQTKDPPPARSRCSRTCEARARRAERHARDARPGAHRRARALRCGRAGPRAGGGTLSWRSSRTTARPARDGAQSLALPAGSPTPTGARDSGDEPPARWHRSTTSLDILADQPRDARAEADAHRRSGAGGRARARDVAAVHRSARERTRHRRARRARARGHRRDARPRNRRQPGPQRLEVHPGRAIRVELAAAGGQAEIRRGRPRPTSSTRCSTCSARDVGPPRGGRQPRESPWPWRAGSAMRGGSLQPVERGRGAPSR